MNRLKSLAAGPALAVLCKAVTFSLLQARQRGGMLISAR